MLLLRGVSTTILDVGADVVGADDDSATAAYAAVVDRAATSDSCESGARRWAWVWARRWD